MGSRIAAHFANAGIPSDLLDVSTEAAAKGIQTAIKQKPGAFFLDSSAALITPGNFNDHLDRVAQADWIIEAVTEKLDVKRSLWSKVEPLRRPDAIVSTNTSGIPLRQISEGFSAEFRRHFLGTHFFNPPRYLHLLELIPGVDTDPEILAFVASFAERRLGQGDCSVQGHAQLHRQSHRMLLLRNRIRDRSEGRLHGGRGGRAHRAS